jgi:hypothetical protein
MGGFRVDRVCRTSVRVTVGDGRMLLDRCHLAERPWARLVGLLGTADLDVGEGLWLSRCGAVHTLGMRMPIACAFLDGAGRVLRVVDPLPPWRLARAAGARSVVESRAGAFAGLAPGDRLVPVGAEPGRRDDEKNRS